MGAWVIYDPYWDPHAAYADKAEAEAQCQPGERFTGCHVLWAEDADPGDLSRMSGDEFGDFLRSFEGHRPSEDNQACTRPSIPLEGAPECGGLWCGMKEM